MTSVAERGRVKKASRRVEPTKPRHIAGEKMVRMAPPLLRPRTATACSG